MKNILIIRVNLFSNRVFCYNFNKKIEVYDIFYSPLLKKVAENLWNITAWIFPKLSCKFFNKFFLNRFAVKWIVLNLLTYEQMNNKIANKVYFFLLLIMYFLLYLLSWSLFVIINSDVCRGYREKNMNIYHGRTIFFFIRWKCQS